MKTDLRGLPLKQRAPSWKVDGVPCPSGGTASIAPPAVDVVAQLETALAAARARISKLELLREVDALLNILNRRGFERELARALDYVKRYQAVAALVYIDLDDFKQINDRYGHAAGDEVLKTVARMLIHTVRSSD